MHQVIGDVDALAGVSQGVLVEDVALDDLGAGESAGEALGVPSKTPNRVAGFE
jgi:hypothetical protein